MSNTRNIKRLKNLGQHILIDETIVDKIIKNCNLNKEDKICEMGTGTGRLTRRIAEFGNQVKSFEIDKNLFEKVKILENKFPNLTIINDNLLSHKYKKIEFDVFISNIPYSKSREIFFWLATKKFHRAIVMVQKEFADKLQKNYGSLNYRAISAICQYRFNIEELFLVGTNAFDPVPKVESKVIRLTTKKKINVDNNGIFTEDEIKKINLIFSSKNKLISYLCKKYSIIDNNPIIKKYIENKSRIRDLEPDTIVNLVRNCDIKVK